MDKEEAIQFILAKTHKAWENYSKTFNLERLKMPEIRIINKPKSVAGTAFRSHKVEFNLPYCILAKESYKEIIYHELAHIIQFSLFPTAKQAHGPEFRYILQSQGFAGKTYHYYSVKEAKSISKKTDLLLLDTLTEEELEDF